MVFTMQKKFAIKIRTLEIEMERFSLTYYYDPFLGAWILFHPMLHGEVLDLLCVGA